jgi:signal transduction histidine kinase
VRQGDEPVAAILHDPAVLDDPGLLAAVSSAARLAASNARLHTELEHRVIELSASRRRILEVGVRERSLLERRLEEGAERRLEALAGALKRSFASASRDETKKQIARAQDQLDHTLEDVHGIALGLHPRVLSEGGLSDALALLAEGIDTPVTLEVTTDHVPAQVETVVYFVCSEAFANITKYAYASRVRVSVTEDDDLVTAIIEDDGVGGADLAAGTGLRGLADRVETIGGTLRVGSAPGQGTRITAEIPLDGDAQ